MASMTASAAVWRQPQQGVTASAASRVGRRARSVSVAVRANVPDATQKSQSPPPQPRKQLTRHEAFVSAAGASLAGALLNLAAVATVGLTAAPPALAIFNKDLDVPITDPVGAMATVLATKVAVNDILLQIADFEVSCPAPVFPCDLSQISTKTATRVSGPLKRSLPTLSEAYGADPYAVQDIIQSVSTTEAMLMANNARVKVDWKGPTTFLNLVNDSIDALLADVSPDAVAGGQARFDACDMTVDPKAPGDLECRLARAVASGARPMGGIS
eukprot:CAMPEP_0197589290 /NCGR_PEP_ID=MMETSP1326-20131121/10282_1 /TAXON_ID=1155430 /ORGANISM="Genus nov. species nov., Strain RCC2288" /LENGTH=271 /DNA_ID=CAMNT_0043154207 /DNA_START=53 /DNA_END=868 /DNA_ORIENTATION=-